MKKNLFTTLIVILIALLPAGYLALIWDSLPQSVPVHFGANMKPDRIGDKKELWLVVGLMAAVSVGIYFLLNNLHRFDPKRKGMPPSSSFRKLATGLVVFLSALSMVIVASAKGGVDLQKLLFPLLGLLFAFLGNYMHNIKPNYFAGIRLPWTLSSDENWRRTHQLAGKIWFAGGLLLVIAGLLLPATFMWIVVAVLVLVMIVIPTVYSYRLFRQQQ
jgi:uncharacterized membrane protein